MSPDPRRGLIHHLIVKVTDLQRSSAFYGPLFEFMGYALTGCSADFQDWRRVDLNGMPEISLVQVTPDLAAVPYVRGAVGHHHHIAFNAESRQAVEECAALLGRLAHTGGKLIYPPRDYPQYSPGYYAVFFEDPDGLYLEFAYTPSSGKKMPLGTTPLSADDRAGA
jgi:predicted enzyme related to lactoylglutathione lyase